MVADDDNILNSNPGKVAYGFLKEFFKDLANGGKNYLTRKRIGFLPKGMANLDFSKVEKTQLVKQIKYLIDQHETVPIIILGLYLDSLNPNDRKEVLPTFRDSVYEKHRSFGVCVLNLAITGFIKPYIKWLSTQTIDKELDIQQRIDIHQKILVDWEERTLFVQNHNSSKYIKQVCVSKIGVGKDVFFIFASGSLIRNVEKSLEELEKEGIFKESNYHHFSNNLHNTENEKVWFISKKNDSE